jgi:hypothetical protein
LGSISDPLDPTGWNAAAETFTESGSDSDPNFATDLLSRLQYNAPDLPNGQGFATQASITVSDGGVAAADAIPIKIGVVSPPAITGTVPDQPVAAGDLIAPFAIVNVTNPWFDYYYYTLVAGNPYTTEVATPGETDYDYNPTDTVTIAIIDGGQATDADGLLTGPGLSKTGVGTYSLITQQYYNIGYALQNLKFTTNTLPAGAAENPIFQVKVTDTTSGLSTTDSNTSLLILGRRVEPIIAGTQAGQTVAPGNVIDPFASVTITDTNQPNPMDSATITLTNAPGTPPTDVPGAPPTDASGTLTGTGLTETAAGSGIYTLAAADPATLTSELDALTFHPTGLPSGVASETTRFTLTVSDPAYALLPVADANTTVTEPPPLLGPFISVAEPAPPVNFIVNDETTGQTTEQAGTPISNTTLELSVTDTKSGLSANYKAATPGQTGYQSFSTVTVADANPGASDIAFIDMGSPSAGSLSLPSDPSALTASLGGERYTLSATDPATLTKEIDGLFFTPASPANEFIDITPDNLNIAAVTPSVYIHTGDGNDGINVSYAGGNNTLDGEGGVG